MPVGKSVWPHLSLFISLAAAYASIVYVNDIIEMSEDPASSMVALGLGACVICLGVLLWVEGITRRAIAFGLVYLAGFCLTISGLIFSSPQTWEDADRKANWLDHHPAETGQIFVILSLLSLSLVLATCFWLRFNR